MRLRITALIIAIGAVFAILASGAFAATDYYVDKTYGIDSNSGTSWGDAFATVQKGIDSCGTGSSGDPDIVHVAAETYYENIVLDSHVTLLGGYPPGGGDRDWEANLTSIDGSQADVVVNLYEDDGVTIDGFTIEHGESQYGGGIACEKSELEVLNCTVRHNKAFQSGTDDAHARGGGLYCNGSTVTLVNCTVRDNTAEADAATYSWKSKAFAYGGGIYLADCIASLIECTVRDNTAYADSESYIGYWDDAYAEGGGIYSLSSSPALIHTTVISNTAYARAYWEGSYGQSYGAGGRYSPLCGVGDRYASAVGGGIWCRDSYNRTTPPRLRNCLVAENVIQTSIPWGYSDSYEAAGGIFSYVAYSYNPAPVLTNTTVADNTKHGIYSAGYAEPTLTDCILWGNGDDVYGVSCSGITYCDIEDGDCASGEGNMSEDPLFVEGYYLSQTAAGQENQSPCVDAGSDDALSLGLASRSTRTDGEPDLDVVDLGWHYPSNDDNHDPTLYDGRVEPDHGREDTTFTYRVHYYDQDDDAPTVGKVYIDDDAGHDMTLESGNAANGTYFYQTNLPEGEHEFYFYFEDGNGGSCRDPRDGTYHGPSVDGDTSLSNGAVEPSSGTTATVFEYTVDYYDANGYAPSLKKVYIDYDSGHDMTLDSGDAADGTYIFETTLSSGDHNFYFYFENGHSGSDKDPETGVYEGPTVNDPPVLSDGQVDPESGTICRKYTYTVHYLDPEGHAPSVSLVIIDGEHEYEMSLKSGDPGDGVYLYRTRLSEGDHTYYFYFEDDHSASDKDPEYGAYDGATVTWSQCEYYVDATYGDDDNDGLSWNDAFATIQMGIDTCQTGSGSSPDIVHVAAGTYCENTDLDSYIVLLGGYPPGGGTRDPDANETVIDGSASGKVMTVDNKDGVTIDGFTIQNGVASDGGGIYCYSSSPTLTDCTVSDNETADWFDGGGIYCCNESSPTLTNCTISGNRANHGYGGGICCDSSSPTLTNCTISGNEIPTSGGGGGIYCCNGSSPTLTNCTISGNVVGDYSGGGILCEYSSPTLTNCTISSNMAAHGGGLSCLHSSPTLTNCMLTDNTVNNEGGGILCYSSSSPTLTNCTIMDNEANDGGGVLCYSGSSPTLTNCTIMDNEANERGGGIYCHYSSSPALTNCTISGNTADSGGGIYCFDSSCEPEILNSILWGDGPNEIAGDTGNVTVAYSDVQGGWSGTGNIDEDPMFCQRGGDTNYDGYFLKQENDGQGWPSSERSPCIDAGDPSSDPFGGTANTEYSTAVNGFLDTNRVDMGYHYEYGGCTYINLTSFEAWPRGSAILVTWETGAEIRNAGFVLFREIAGTQDYMLISDLIPAQGTPTSGASYSFTDGDVELGITYSYWLVDIDTSGKWTAHGPASAAAARVIPYLCPEDSTTVLR